MKRLVTILLLATLAGFLPSQAQLALGKWRDHLSYNTIYKVCATNDKVYCSAAGGLFYYDMEDMTINRLNKTTNLNDVGISTFAYDPQTRCLVVAYNNANIDIVRNDVTINISDIKRSNIGGNRKINNICFHNRCAYLSCGFGIVVVDLTRMEIKETYYLGADGTYMNINDIAFTDSLIVAATDNGVMYAPHSSNVLNIVSSWSLDTTSLIASSTVSRLLSTNGKIMALAYSPGSDTAIYEAGNDMVFYPWLSGNINNINYRNNKTIVCYNDHIEIYSLDKSLIYNLGTIDWMKMEPNDADLTDDGRLWIAHKWAALAMIEPDEATSVTILAPPRPNDDNVFRLTSFDKELFVAPGGHTTTFANSYLPANIYTFSNEEWHSLNDPNRLLNSAFDIIDIAVNPRDNKQRMAAAWGSGIVEINGNTVTNLYTDSNTNGVLTPYDIGGFRSLRTGGVTFDRRGNAWIINSLSPNALNVRHADGSWQSFNTLSMVGGGDIDHIIWDSINDMKIFWGHANRIYLHDGEGKMAYIDPNNGSRLETSMVNCVVQDHNGNFWIGTNKGIKVVYDAYKAFQNGGNGEKSPITCSNILYNENGISEYLLAYESVTCIAVDGANRKWIGTSTGGLYLISANGLEQITHFNADNSPLFSDKIVTLAIMPWSGELFIGTDKGLQSYRASATYAFDTPMEDIHAFPNPVRPDYDGPIAIKGFTRNALVHVTDAAGQTVFSTRANGGQAVWNGRNLQGQRVASGVYYVFASAEDGSMRSATKILIVR